MDTLSKDQISQQIQEYIQDLNRDALLSGGLSIVLTAVILTAFELVFFYIIVAPGVITQMENGIQKGSKKIAKDATKNKELASIINATVFNDNTAAALTTISEREDQLIEKINFYTQGTGLIILLFLSLIISYFIVKINRSSKVGSKGFNVALWTSAVTVTSLIAFQAYFYKFGLKYNYPGSFGNEEFLATVYNAIDA